MVKSTPIAGVLVVVVEWKVDQLKVPDEKIPCESEQDKLYFKSNHVKR